MHSGARVPCPIFGVVLVDDVQRHVLVQLCFRKGRFLKLDPHPFRGDGEPVLESVEPTLGFIAQTSDQRYFSNNLRRGVSLLNGRDFG